MGSVQSIPIPKDLIFIPFLSHFYIVFGFPFWSIKQYPQEALCPMLAFPAINKLLFLSLCENFQYRGSHRSLTTGEQEHLKKFALQI